MNCCKAFRIIALGVLVGLDVWGLVMWAVFANLCLYIGHGY
jgi:hypothetical protein